VFADRVNDYDLFIYSEDDTLVTLSNVRAFLRVTALQNDNEVAGFLRFEEDTTGNRFLPDVHASYHWDARSVRSRSGHVFAFFSNEHAAAYILTQAQLRRAIESGGFMVGPHQGRYDLLCSAATDPYTRCGMTKLICISHLDEFLIHHLPNKYIGRLGLDRLSFEYQIQALLRTSNESDPPAPLLNTRCEIAASSYDKDYYEPARMDLVGLVPARAQNVLSIGCGWGATEEALNLAGKRVVGIPMDPIIASCAQARGVQIVPGDLHIAVAALSGRTFDCMLISNLLHLAEEPDAILKLVAPLLSPGAIVITTVPNLLRATVTWKRVRGVKSHSYLGDYPRSGVHMTSHRIVGKWLTSGGLRLHRFVDVIPEAARKLSGLTLGLVNPFVSSEIVAVASRE
jgi:2-polyprenyl-3-methyl-5-hydroxy-6-metoxy-1,4-benzoquinol methylase